MNAVIYCRVSTTEQASGTSIDIQDAQCREYCTRNGLDVLATFRDRGESAKTSDRPEFLRMVQFCSSNKVDACVVHKLDRFSRNAYDYAVFQALLAKVGTSIQSATEPITDSPAGKLMQTILAGVAQFDNDVRAERSRSGMAEIANRGGWTHQAPFGMLSARKDGIPILVPDPDIAPAIVEMFRQVASGRIHHSSCSRWLASRLGRPIRPQTIAKMLRQRVYMGEICNRLTGGIPVKAAFPPLVDPDTWHEVQAKFQKGTNRIRTIRHAFTLHGVALCECGRKVSASMSRSKTGRRYGYYHCRHCSTRIPVGLVHENLALFLADVGVSMMPMLKCFRLVVADRYRVLHAEAIAEQAKRQAEISKIDKHAERLLDMMISGRITAEVYDRKRRDLDIQKAVAKSAMQDAGIDEMDSEAVLSTSEFIFSSLYETLCRTPQETKPALTKAIFGGFLTLHADGKVSNSHKAGVFNILREYTGRSDTMAPPRGTMSNSVHDILTALAVVVNYAKAA